MRKIMLLVLAVCFAACGPKRMKCYGRRCVTIDVPSAPSSKAKLPS
ncbi:hypothetical protein [Flavobacterium sp.]